MPFTAAIVARGLRKRYGSLHALNGLDLTIPRGSMYGILGHNGAGKSTTIGILCGLTRADAGEVEVAGLAFGRELGKAEELRLKASLGVVLESHPLFENLTPREYLGFVGEMKGLSARDAQAEARRLLGVVKLAEGDRLLRELSKGTKQKAAIASAFMAGPDVVILDEPFVGIDPVSMRAIKDHLLAYAASGKTVLFSSHVLELVERVCSHVTIIARGRNIVEGPLAELTRAGRTLEEIFLEAVEPPEVRDAGAAPAGEAGEAM